MSVMTSQTLRLDDLNRQQYEAVVIPDGPVLVLAGPGSGKTRVLTHRIAWMQQEIGIPPWQIMAVTFTNKAAREMRDRLGRMVGESEARAMTLGTFHATCARILRYEADAAELSSDYLIFDTDDQLAVMKQVVADLGLDDERYRPRSLLNAISSAKNELIPPADLPTPTYYDEIVARAYARYQETLRQNNGLDFDDLLMETAKLLRDQPLVLEKYRDRYQHILVDEFQDTNMAQYVILRLLAKEHRSLYAVADEDQSIYSWRGADYRNIQRLRKDFPELETLLLEENYRSTQVILDAAQAVIAHNNDRTPKHLFTRKEGGAAIRIHEAYDEKEEAAFVAREIQKKVRDGYQYGDIAMMYRTNAQSRALEEALVKRNLPYQIIGATRFYARREIKDVLAYLRLVQNPDDDVSFLRVINTPRRGIGRRTQAKVSEEANRLGVSRWHGMQSLLQSGALGTRTHNALLAFASMVEQWHQARENENVVQLLDDILADIGYENYLRDGASSEEGDTRWENVLALRALLTEDPDISLIEFLTEVALVADVDALSEEMDAVKLLTLHSAKGLEFPIVFITGMEEGRLPHSRSMETPQEIAEERRLLYVGMTRAEEELILTYAFRRSWGWGEGEPAESSRFLHDIPDEVLQRPRQAKKSRQSRNWAASSWPQSQRTISSSPPQLEYRTGQRVRHAHYGEGIVMESERDGRSEMVTVIFEGVGPKRLLASMAPMEPLSEH